MRICKCDDGQDLARPESLAVSNRLFNRLISIRRGHLKQFRLACSAVHHGRGSDAARVSKRFLITSIENAVSLPPARDIQVGRESQRLSTSDCLFRPILAARNHWRLKPIS